MKALVKYAAGVGNVGIRDIPVREPEEDELKEPSGGVGDDFNIDRF